MQLDQSHLIWSDWSDLRKLWWSRSHSRTQSQVLSRRKNICENTHKYCVMVRPTARSPANPSKAWLVTRLHLKRTKKMCPSTSTTSSISYQRRQQVVITHHMPNNHHEINSFISANFCLHHFRYLNIHLICDTSATASATMSTVSIFLSGSTSPACKRAWEQEWDDVAVD